MAAHQHFARAVELATQAGDNYRASYGLRHAGMMLINRDQPNNALKLTQLADPGFAADAHRIRSELARM